MLGLNLVSVTACYIDRHTVKVLTLLETFLVVLYYALWTETKLKEMTARGFRLSQLSADVSASPHFRKLALAHG